MLAGFARESISTFKSYVLAGFDLRTAPLAGTLDDINVTAACLVSDAGETLLILSFDLLGVPAPFCEKLRQALSAKGDIVPENILILATHTHAAPRAVFGYKEGDGEYIDLLIASALRAANAARERAEPVSALFGEGTVPDIASYRDVPRERSRYDMPLLRLRLCGSKNCDLIRFTCHPTVLNENNLLLSKDLAGAWQEEETLKQALMMNGACGDISTRYTRIGKGEAELMRMKAALAKAIVSLELKPVPHFGNRIRCACREVTLRNAVPLKEEQKRALTQAHEQALASVTDEAAKRERVSILAVLRRPPRERPRERSVRLFLADLGAVILFALPFEINSGDGERMENELGAVAGKRVVLLCYANGYEGYLPSGKPITAQSSYQDVAAGLDYTAKEELLAAAKRLIKNNTEE